RNRRSLLRHASAHERGRENFYWLRVARSLRRLRNNPYLYYMCDFGETTVLEEWAGQKPESIHRVLRPPSDWAASTEGRL
ncbi:hypothetical protein CSUI_008796, partial [Cystoisospora suis]